jgi:hypothetical protein
MSNERGFFNKMMKMMSFRQISIRELPTWVKVLQQEPDPITDRFELLAELNLIDDLLTLQKAQSLLNRKRNLKAQLEARKGSKTSIAYRIVSDLINGTNKTYKVYDYTIRPCHTSGKEGILQILITQSQPKLF